jgi:hypothetical protein
MLLDLDTASVGSTCCCAGPVHSTAFIHISVMMIERGSATDIVASLQLAR